MKYKTKIIILCTLILALLIIETFEVDAFFHKRRRRRGCSGVCGTEGCPPCPPPPCPIQSLGCYKQTGFSLQADSVKADFGSLLPGEFAYFLPADKCISSGSCDCKGVPSNIVQQANPDDSSGACTCIAGTAWDAKGKCCGDDADDCSRISSGVLCSIDSNEQTANWVPSSSNIGDIRYVGCTKREYLSNGDNWIKCDGTFSRQNVGSSEYLCIGTGQESIVECCGDGACKSKVDGKRIQTGGSVTASDNKVYYCTPNRKFVTDLDADQAGVSSGSRKSTCEKAGFTWTGTKCCSEADDGNEYYNDLGGTGGCWNKKPAISVNFVDGTKNSVINYNGEFHGCVIDKLSNIVDKHSGLPLITNHYYCSNEPDTDYYCSSEGEWVPTAGTDKTHFSLAPEEYPLQSGNCCTQSECWDGEKCIVNQRANPLAQPLNGFRCIDGDWVESEQKSTPEGTVTGYCPKKTQCLVNVFGNEGSQCIENNNYTSSGDNYCENGNWSSRTKLLALKLLNLKSGDFTLFCDDRKNSLNNLQYLTESGEIVSNVLTNLQTNNFCVLKSGNKVVAATSISKNIEELPKNSLNILGLTNCDSALINDGQYHSCDSTNKVWYNKKIKSFIYSEVPITIPYNQNIFGLFEEVIGAPIKKIIDAIKRLITNPPFDDSYVRGIKKFDKLYINQKGSTSIRGSIEGKTFKNAVVQYTGFNSDICKFIEQFNQARKDISSGVSCKNEGNNYYVLAQGSQLSNIDPESIWPDLTSKLRLK